MTQVSDAFVCSIVVIDMVHFTKSMSLLETLGLPRGTHAQFIDTLVVSTLTDLGLPTERDVNPSFPSAMPLLKYTGDGAIFHFTDATTAVQFAEKLQDLSMRENQSRAPAEKLLFRVGIATGLVEQVELQLSSADLAGSTIGNAARLEGACAVGEVTIDSASYQALDASQRQTYSNAYKVKGKASDQKEYFCHSRCVNTDAAEDFLHQPGWRFFRHKASILRAIESRLRETHPAFSAGWADDLKRELQAKNDDLVSAVRDHSDPHEVIEVLADHVKRIPGGDVMDSGLDELMLFAACRCINFAPIPPPEHVGKSKAERFAVVTRIGSELELLTSICVAGFCGVRLYFREMDVDLGFSVTVGHSNEADALSAALRELYPQVLGEQAPVNRSNEFYAGEIGRWFERHRKTRSAMSQKIAAVTIKCTETDQFHREIALNLARQLNHVVNCQRSSDPAIALEVDDGVTRFHARIHRCLKALIHQATAR